MFLFRRCTRALRPNHRAKAPGQRSPLQCEFLEDRVLLAVISDFPIPTANAAPLEITAGPDGNLWFTESGANKIGRMTPAGVVTGEFAIPTPNSAPYLGITTGPDGNLW